MAAPGTGDSNRNSSSPQSQRSARRRKLRMAIGSKPLRTAEPSRPSQRVSESEMVQSSNVLEDEEADAREAAAKEGAVVHSFRPKPQPSWLLFLLRLQQGSAIITLTLVAGVLIVYGWTVYIQQRWGQGYEKLETLKKQERQLISANEVLKNQMAEQAENPTAGLLLPDPSNAIFLTPAPQRPEVKPQSPVSPNEQSSTRPLGY